ncbi:MAG: glycosyltransferase family 9 protein [Calditrichia bacterium]
MEQKLFYKSFFHFSSFLTDHSPRFGKWALDLATSSLYGNPQLIKMSFRLNGRRLQKIKRFENILVIGDLNIGDAVNLQVSISAIRNFFPKANIDYIINRNALNLVDGNPEITRIWPVFAGSALPTDEDLENVRQIMAMHSYDVIFNFCPFFKKNLLFAQTDNVINFFTLVSSFIRNERNRVPKNQVAYQTYLYLHHLLSTSRPVEKREPFRGPRIYLSDVAIRQAQAFLRNHKIAQTESFIFLNPDANSRFTRIPLQTQIELLRELIKFPNRILIGAGHKHKNIERELLNALTPEQKEKITVIPTTLPLDAYTALLDYADIFISGDTGPLHLAAVRKVSRSGKHAFRNRTAVISVFGATAAHIYGYDSEKPGFIPAYQDAPSHAHIAGSPCRNITCINKMAKTCKQVRCFDSLDIAKICSDIRSHLAGHQQENHKEVEKIKQNTAQII